MMSRRALSFLVQWMALGPIRRPGRHETFLPHRLLRCVADSKRREPRGCDGCESSWPIRRCGGRYNARKRRQLLMDLFVCWWTRDPVMGMNNGPTAGRNRSLFCPRVRIDFNVITRASLSRSSPNPSQNDPNGTERTERNASLFWLPPSTDGVSRTRESSRIFLHQNNTEEWERNLHTTVSPTGAVAAAATTRTTTTTVIPTRGTSTSAQKAQQK